MLTKMTPCMMVHDLGATVEYYRDILGFSFVGGVAPQSQEAVTRFDKSQPLAFAMMKQGQVEIMFMTKESFVNEFPHMGNMAVGGTVEFYMDLPDAKPLYEQLRGKVRMVVELHRTFYGKDEFVIQDCNGYTLCFASAVAEALP